MQFTPASFVTNSIEHVKVLVSGQTNKVLNV
jgi:hypothetical protein